MNITEYEKKARKYAMYPYKTNMSVGIMYNALKLSGEVGELNDKLGKCISDSNGEISPELLKEIEKEMGDILWHYFALMYDLGLSINHITRVNIDKLESRRLRNKMAGSGDNR